MSKSCCKFHCPTPPQQQVEALHPTPYTCSLYSKPYTLNLHPTPRTLHHRPKTQNPKPKTQNPKPKTPNPKPTAAAAAPEVVAGRESASVNFEEAAAATAYAPVSTSKKRTAQARFWPWLSGKRPQNLSKCTLLDRKRAVKASTAPEVFVGCKSVSVNFAEAAAPTVYAPCPLPSEDRARSRCFSQLQVLDPRPKTLDP